MIRVITEHDIPDVVVLLQQLSPVPVNPDPESLRSMLQFYEKCGMMRGDKTAFIKRF